MFKTEVLSLQPGHSNSEEAEHTYEAVGPGLDSLAVTVVGHRAHRGGMAELRLVAPPLAQGPAKLRPPTESPTPSSSWAHRGLTCWL